MSQPALDPNLLVAFDVLLEQRSVTRAAEQLGITQSAMSHRLRRLREHFDDPLVVPGRDGLVPTELARAVAVPLHRALVDLRNAVEAPRTFDPKRSQREFVVAGSDYGEFVSMPYVLDRLGEQAPSVTVRSEGYGPTLLKQLEEGAVDLAIGPALPGVAGFRRRSLLTEGFVVAVRKGHPLVRRRPTLKRYLQLAHLLVAPRGNPGGVVDDWLAERQLKRRVVLRVRHFAPAGFIVARSDLVWTAPEFLAAQAAEYVDLQLFEPPFEVPAVESFLTWHERFQNDPAHRWARELIVEVSQSRLRQLSQDRHRRVRESRRSR